MTPTFVPVATQAVVKTLDSKETKETGAQLLIANTFHLHLKPGEKVVQKAGGLHQFMNWPESLMTDSAGFQVFSLKNKKIREEGVYFSSPLDGKEIFLGPKESIKIQEALGADIIFAFDECIPPGAEYQYVKQSVARTNRWAEICLKTKKSKQALYGVIQGEKFKDLRKESANFISRLDFDGFGIGGEFGEDKKKMTQMIGWVNEELPEKKPRHLLGIGHPEDIAKVIRAGIDTFDCVTPTRFARHGAAFTSTGRINLSQTRFLKDKNPLDKKCDCFVCQSYKRNYLSHLFRANEMTGMKFLTFHNLYFFNQEVKKIRQKIKEGDF